MDKQKIKEYQRKHRENPTKAEVIFEEVLRELKVPFEPQKICKCGNNWFIVDFYIRFPYKVVIEIDGGSHDYKMAYDDKRETLITQKKPLWSIWRFTNEEILRDKDKVKSDLGIAFRERAEWKPSQENINEIIKQRKIKQRERDKSLTI